MRESPMVFNFYLNKDGEQVNNDELEDIMKKMEIHFADWHDFYQYYMKNAKPPNKNTDKIQQFFNDLRNDFVKIIQQYNDKINDFAEIQDMEKQDDDFESQVINQMKTMMDSKDKSDTDSNSNINMYN